VLNVRLLLLAKYTVNFPHHDQGPASVTDERVEIDGFTRALVERKRSGTHGAEHEGHPDNKDGG